MNKLALASIALLVSACARSGSGASGSSVDGGSGSADGGSPFGTGNGPCENGGTTTISGTVYDPALRNPLYNVAVYVPGSTPLALPSGATCDACNSLYTGSPVASALTDASGSFKIRNAPSGSNVPLVIQIGKWRKQLRIATVTACKDNPQPDKSLSLPRNGNEGDIPSIAVSTGALDSLECLFERVGLDATEYTGGAGGKGHIHIFEGTANEATIGRTLPPTMTPAASSSVALWDSKVDLMPYDIVVLSCEGAETRAMNQVALEEYTNAGGRVFASHFHYAWFNTGPFGAYNLANWLSAGDDSISSTSDPTAPSIDAVVDQTLSNGSPFPKGEVLESWLRVVGAIDTSAQIGGVTLYDARHNADVTAANTHSQSWLRAAPNTSAPGASLYFSFDTPVNAPLDDAGQPTYCGRVVFSDLHVTSDDTYAPDYAEVPESQAAIVPAGCVDRGLSPQERVLEFMLFDLSSCVVSDSEPPPPPPK